MGMPSRWTVGGIRVDSLSAVCSESASGDTGQNHGALGKIVADNALLREHVAERNAIIEGLNEEVRLAKESLAERDSIIAYHETEQDAYEKRIEGLCTLSRTFNKDLGEVCADRRAIRAERDKLRDDLAKANEVRKGLQADLEDTRRCRNAAIVQRDDLLADRGVRTLSSTGYVTPPTIQLGPDTIIPRRLVVSDRHGAVIHDSALGIGCPSPRPRTFTAGLVEILAGGISITISE